MTTSTSQRSARLNEVVDEARVVAAQHQRAVRRVDEVQADAERVDVDGEDLGPAGERADGGHGGRSPGTGDQDAWDVTTHVRPP